MQPCRTESTFSRPSFIPNFNSLDLGNFLNISGGGGGEGEGRANQGFIEKAVIREIKFKFVFI